MVALCSGEAGTRLPAGSSALVWLGIALVALAASGRVVRGKRHRGEAYVVVAVEDGSRQLIAVRNTELADARLSPFDLCFTPGSLRALVDVINDCRGRAEREGDDASASSKRPSSVGIVPAGGTPASRDALDRAAAASAPRRRGRGQSTGRS